MRAEIVSFEAAGLILRQWRRQFTVTYGEILTAERRRARTGLRLHVRTGAPVDVRSGRLGRSRIEDELRRRGVRVVDCWGAIIAPTLEDFQTELAREPVRMRQSSDNA